MRFLLLGVLCVSLHGCIAARPFFDVDFGHIQLPAESVELTSTALPVTAVDRIEVVRMAVQSDEQLAATGFTGISIQTDTFLSYIVRYYLTMPSAPQNTDGWRALKENDDGTFTLRSHDVRLRGDATIPIYFSADQPSGAYQLTVKINGSTVLETQVNVDTEDLPPQ
ncbi:MAG: hypothetical protein AAF004_03740 [Pseudomonadota bacterium]